MEDSSCSENKPTLREKQKQQLRQELISAAFELFTENGLDFPSVDQIVERTGVAKGTFYLYFSSKADIIHAIVNEKLTEFEAAVASALENPPPDAHEALRAVVMAQMSFFMQNPTATVLLMHGQGIVQGDLPKEISDELMSRFREATTAVYERIIRLGMLQQRYREVDAWVAARTLFGVLAVLSVQSTDVPYTELAEAALDVLDKGMRLKP